MELFIDGRTIKQKQYETNRKPPFWKKYIDIY